MILSDKEVIARLSSPMNLINKIGRSPSRSSAMGLFGVGRKDSEKEKIIDNVDSPIKEEIRPGILTKEVEQSEALTISFNPFERSSAKQEETISAVPASDESAEQITADNLLSNSDQQIKLSIAHDKALEVLTSAVSMISNKLDEVKADRLPAVITAASKVIDNIRRERNEAAKGGRDREVHYHFYTPVQRQMADYGEVIEVTQ